jgi:hypothetical protein
VTVDVPPHSIVGGNPAKILRSGIRTLKWGVIEDAYARAMATERDALRNGPLDEGLPVSAENPTVIRRGVYESKTG